MAALSEVVPSQQSDTLVSFGSAPFCPRLARQLAEIAAAPWRRPGKKLIDKQTRSQSTAAKLAASKAASPLPLERQVPLSPTPQWDEARKSPSNLADFAARQRLPSPGGLLDPSTTKAPGQWPRARTPMLALAPLSPEMSSVSKRLDQVISLRAVPASAVEVVDSMDKALATPILSLAPIQDKSAAHRQEQILALPSTREQLALPWVEVEGDQWPSQSSTSQSKAGKNLEASDTPSTAYDSEEARDAVVAQATGSTAKAGAGPVPGVISTAIEKLTRSNAVWDAPLWKRAREESMHSGKISQLNALLRCVRISSENALRRELYYIKSRSNPINLGAKLEVVVKAQWFGRENVNSDLLAFEQPAGMVVPPLLMCERSALETAMDLRYIVGKNCPIYVVLEVAQFTDAGAIDLARPACMYPSCVSQRSDFCRFADAASMQLRDGQATMKEHLCAQRDPYVVLCPDVTLFRGSREDGYPFLEEPLKLHVVVAAMSSARPDVQIVHSIHDRTEWYQSERDHTALLERLNLMGLVALQREDAPGGAVQQQPILVLSVPGCGGQCKHPRDAVANSLKQWRRRFSPLFRSVYVCTGRGSDSRDQDLAQHLDETVNRQFYRVACSEALFSKVMDWHWDPGELGLTYNSDKLRKLCGVYRRLQGKRTERSDFFEAAEACPAAQSSHLTQRQSMCVLDALNMQMRASYIKDQLEEGSVEGVSNRDEQSDFSAGEEDDMTESDDEGPPPTQLVGFSTKDKKVDSEPPPQRLVRPSLLGTAAFPNLGVVTKKATEGRGSATSFQAMHLTSPTATLLVKCMVEDTMGRGKNRKSKREGEANDDSKAPEVVISAHKEKEDAATTALSSILASLSAHEEDMIALNTPQNSEDQSGLQSNMCSPSGSWGNIGEDDAEPHAGPSADGPDKESVTDTSQAGGSSSSTLPQKSQQRLCDGFESQTSAQSSSATSVSSNIGSDRKEANGKQRRHSACANPRRGSLSGGVGEERIQQYQQKRRNSLENARRASAGFDSESMEAVMATARSGDKDTRRGSLLGSNKTETNRQERRKSWSVTPSTGSDTGPSSNPAYSRRDSDRTDQQLAIRAEAREKLRNRRPSQNATCTKCGEFMTQEQDVCRKCGTTNRNYFQANSAGAETQPPTLATLGPETILRSSLRNNSLRSSLRSNEAGQDCGRLSICSTASRKPSVQFQSKDDDAEDEQLDNEGHTMYPKESWVAAKSRKTDNGNGNADERQSWIKKKISQVGGPSEQGDNQGVFNQPKARHLSLTVSSSRQASPRASESGPCAPLAASQVKELDNLAQSMEDRLEKMRRVSGSSDVQITSDLQDEETSKSHNHHNHHHHHHHHRPRHTHHGSHASHGNTLSPKKEKEMDTSKRRKWGTHHGAHGHHNTLTEIDENAEVQEPSFTGAAHRQRVDSFVHETYAAAPEDGTEEEDVNFRGVPRKRQLSQTDKTLTGRRTSHFNALGSRNFFF